MILVASDWARRDESKWYIIYPQKYRLSLKFIVYPKILSFIPKFLSFIPKIYRLSSNFISYFEKNFTMGGATFGVTALWQRARLKLRYARSGRSVALRAPPLPPLASLRLSREPYATARQFA